MGIENPQWMESVVLIIDSYFPKDRFVVNIPGRAVMKDLIANPIYESSILVIIFLNMVSLSLNHYPMDPEFADCLDDIEFTCVLVFAVDMMIRMVVLGIRGYWGDMYNLADGLVTLVSIVEISLLPPLSISTTSPARGIFSALTTLRVFRIRHFFRTLITTPRLYMIIDTYTRTAIDLPHFLFLMFLLLYMYSIVGMGFFANRFRFDDHGLPIEEILSEEWRNAPGKATVPCTHLC